MTRTMRATKTSLAIKMKCALFLTLPRQFISVNSLKMANTGRWTSLRTQRQNWICSCVHVLQKLLEKELYGRVRTAQVVKKSALDVQNLLFFIYLLGSLPSASPSPSPLLPGFIDVRKRLWIRTHFSKNACHLFTSQIYMIFKIHRKLKFGWKGKNKSSLF